MRYVSGRRLSTGTVVKRIVVFLSVLCLTVPGALFIGRTFAASPYLASDLIGQTDTSGNVNWTTTEDENRRMPDSGGFGWLSDLKIDYTHHKLYVSESTWNDILVFNLDSSNRLADRVPDYILGV